MVLNSGDIQEGMDVYGSAGDKLGTVKHVFTNGSNANDLGTAGDIEIETVEVIETPMSDTGDMGTAGVAGTEAGSTYTDAGAGSTFGGTTAGDMGTSYGGTTGTTGTDYGSTFGGTGSTYSGTTGGTMGGTGGFGAGTGYIEVHHGGLLGIGGENLYIPFDTIASVDPDNGITLNVTKDEAASMYNEKPAFLSETGT